MINHVPCLTSVTVYNGGNPLAYPALAVFQPLCEYPIYPAPSFQLFNGLFIYFVYMHVSGCVLRSMCGGLLGVSALLPP